MNLKKMYLISAQKWASLSSEQKNVRICSEPEYQITSTKTKKLNEEGCPLSEHSKNNDKDNELSFSKTEKSSRTNIQVDQNENTKVKK